MKLVYVANIRIPTEKAHGHQIMKMAEVFSMAGINLTLLLPTRKNNNFKTTDPFNFYKIKKVFKLKKIFTFDPVFLLNFPAGFYIKVQSLFFIFSLSFYFLSLKRKEQIAYTRDEYLLPFLQLFFSKVIWESHALPNNLNKYKKYFNKCHKIIVLTSEIKKELIGLGINGDNILVSPDAVDLAIFDIEMTKNEARHILNLPPDKFLLGYTGSFKTKGMDKGIADILKSLKLINKSIDFKFVAVGGNSDDIIFYKKLASELQVIDTVEFINKVDQSILAIYQKAFDILLMPFPNTKHYANYMSPLKMFEYLAAKRPIIATKLPTILEILDEQSAYLIEPDNHQEIARAIENLSTDAVKASLIANNAYNLVKDYTWERRAQNIINFMA